MKSAPPDAGRARRSTRTSRRLVVPFAAMLASLLAALGCKARNVPSVDSNTNWLTVCDVDDDCPPADTCQRRVCTPIASAGSRISSGTSAEALERPAAEESDAGTRETPPTCLESCTEAGTDAETCRERCESDVAEEPVERPVTEPTGTADDTTTTDVTDDPSTTDTTTRPTDTTTSPRPSDDPTGSTEPTDMPSDVTDVTMTPPSEPPPDEPLTCYDACVAGGSEATCRDRCLDAADAAKCVDDCTLGASEASCRERCTSLSCYDACLDSGERDATCRERCLQNTSSATCREDCIDGGAEPASCDRYCAGPATDGAAGSTSR